MKMEDVEEHFDDEEPNEVAKKNRSIKKTTDLIKFKLDKLMENFVSFSCFLVNRLYRNACRTNRLIFRNR